MSEFNKAQISPWGYIIDAETIPDFITELEFANFTNGKFGADKRIATNIPSATEAIRNYCGWHVAPSLTCGVIFNVRDLRDAFVGRDLLIQLPATYVSAIEKVVLNAIPNAETNEYDGDVITEYDLGLGTGLLRLYDVGFLDRKSKVFVKYTAGYPKTPSSLRELTADRVTHAVVNPYGVSSESAGGVSVSYSGAWSGSSNASNLADNTKEILNAYKVKGVY